VTDALALVALFGVGVGLGWWLKGRAPITRKRLLIAVAILFGAPLVVFVVANLLSSAALAMIAGLSLMILAAAAVPIGVGFLVGTIAAGRAR
jgi:hypothetical protein